MSTGAEGVKNSSEIANGGNGDDGSGDDGEEISSLSQLSPPSTNLAVILSPSPPRIDSGGGRGDCRRCGCAAAVIRTQALTAAARFVRLASGSLAGGDVSNMEELDEASVA